MKKKFTFLIAAVMLLTMINLPGKAVGQTYTQVTSLSDISEGTYCIAVFYNSNYYTVPQTTISGQTFTCTQVTSFANNVLTPANGHGQFVLTAVSNVNNAFIYIIPI